MFYFMDLLLILSTYGFSGPASGGGEAFKVNGIGFRKQASLGYGTAIEHLLNPEKYHKYIRPGMDPTMPQEPLHIQTTIEVTSLDKVSDTDMEYTITFTLYQSWYDDRLDKWSKTGGNRIVGLKSSLTMDCYMENQIWVPDTYIVNAHKAYIHDVTQRNGLFKLEPDGTVLYVLRITSQVSCPMNFVEYPMDKQVCKLELASWSFSDKDVVYRWGSEENCDKVNSSLTGIKTARLPQFNVTQCVLRTTYHTRRLGNYSLLMVEFTLKRNMLFFVMQTYFPSILLVCLSWVSFWINVSAVPARVALGITTVLSMTTLMIGVYGNGPKSTSNIKAIDFYVIVCYGFIFLAFMEYALQHFLLRYFTNRLNNMNAAHSKSAERNDEKKEDIGHPAYNYQQKGNTQETEFFLNVKQPNGVYTITRGAKKKQLPFLKWNMKDQSGDEKLDNLRWWATQVSLIDMHSRYCFPVLFIAFNICYWAMYTLFSA